MSEALFSVMAQSLPWGSQIAVKKVLLSDFVAIFLDIIKENPVENLIL